MAEHRYVVGLGANLGDAAGALDWAVRALPGVVAVSDLYSSAPVGGPPQPDYLNAAALLVTDLEPRALLDLLHGLERDAGRLRDVRWGPRTLDLDLLDYDGERRATATLTLPHPRMLERAFVRVPLEELLATGPLQGTWAGLRARLADTAANVAAHGVRRYKLT